VKFLLTIGATVLLLLHMRAVTRMSTIAAQQTLSSADFSGLRIQLMVDGGLALLVLLGTTALSVYKPWGMTPYGLRKLRDLRIGGTRVAELPSRASTTWGRYVLMGLIGLVLLALILHLVGGALAATETRRALGFEVLSVGAGLCDKAIPGTRRDEYPGTDNDYLEEQRAVLRLDHVLQEDPRTLTSAENEDRRC
jgi:hypothetical protein